MLPLPPGLPADEEDLDKDRHQLLDVLLAEDQAKAPAERSSAFELYEELTLRSNRLAVSCQQVWEYIAARRSPLAAARTRLAHRNRTSGPGRQASPLTCQAS